MRCWSCGSDLAGGGRYFFTCPLCSQVEELEGIHDALDEDFSKAIEVLQAGFKGVSEQLETGFGALSEQLVNIASIIEWGFEEIGWKLGQIKGTLKSIDDTLKTPSTIQANEWRQIAEELRRREVLGESEKFFLKSLGANPLDYRTYIGLGKTYLQIGDRSKTRIYWGKSLPHAPEREARGAIDYKSYSYRLIGHLDFCEDNPRQAVLILRKAIELSPNYYLGHYDYAQYCALIGDKENCLFALQTAIVKAPVSVQLVRKERNFFPFKKEISVLLEEIKSSKNFQREIKLRSKLQKLGIEGIQTLRNIDIAEWEIEEAEKAIVRLEKMSEGEHRYILKNHQPSVDYWRYAKRQLEDAKESAVSGLETTEEMIGEVNRHLVEAITCALSAKDATVVEERTYKEKVFYLSGKKLN